MQDMFANYNNLNGYVPDNMNYCAHTPISYKKPNEEYDAAGNLEGYTWQYGETVNLHFDLDGYITVDNDDIIYDIANQHPTESTVGTIGQKAFNIVDLKSYTCVGINNGYIWKQDEEFTYEELGRKAVYINAENYVKGKVIKLSLHNFRNEVIYETTFEGKTSIDFQINSELSAKLLYGVYYCSLTLIDNAKLSYLIILPSENCKLIVK